MGFSSQNGYIMMRSQSVAGTYQADTGTAGQAIRLRGGTLAPTRELLVPDPEIGGNRDMPDAYLGTIAWSGTYDLYARMKEMAVLLKGVLGAPSSSTTTGITTHTYTPVSTALPIFSIEECVAGTFDVFRYNDAKVNTFHLEAEANGYLMCSAGMIAKMQTAGNTATNPAGSLYDTSPMIVGTNITVTYNAVSLPAKSFSLDINNNIEDNDFRLGSFYLGDTTEKRRELTMGFTIRPSDSTYWRQAVYGTTAATSAGGIPTKQQTIITLQSYENIPSGIPATAYTLTITVPSSVIRPFAPNPNADDVIEHDLEIVALRPSPATPVATFSLKNDVATIP